ncbi:hypothetical protein F511_40185 [Dorcoceras hygrometricum]|uniref:Uncharacterized protein n=1 Tax=Dorcoceras hygrometricum TaxID=472368 RepID=A0A2Z7CHR4_9LAMI|nr:hypothetical protein F511_40185 [Dorcoceras hygrometricum]
MDLGESVTLHPLKVLNVKSVHTYKMKNASVVSNFIEAKRHIGENAKMVAKKKLKAHDDSREKELMKKRIMKSKATEYGESITTKKPAADDSRQIKIDPASKEKEILVDINRPNLVEEHFLLVVQSIKDIVEHSFRSLMNGRGSELSLDLFRSKPVVFPMFFIPSNLVAIDWRRHRGQTWPRLCPSHVSVRVATIAVRAWALAIKLMAASTKTGRGRTWVLPNRPPEGYGHYPLLAQQKAHGCNNKLTARTVALGQQLGAPKSGQKLKRDYESQKKLRSTGSAKTRTPQPLSTPLFQSLSASKLVRD